MRRVGVYFLPCGSQRLQFRCLIAQFDSLRKRDTFQSARCRNTRRSPRDERSVGACSRVYACACACACARVYACAYPCRLDFSHRLQRRGRLPAVDHALGGRAI
jgi:hypothetical protein